MSALTGRNSFRDLTGDFTPERRQRVEARKAGLRAAMPLHELRWARTKPLRASGQGLHEKRPAADISSD